MIARDPIALLRRPAALAFVLSALAGVLAWTTWSGAPITASAAATTASPSPTQASAPAADPVRPDSRVPVAPASPFRIHWVDTEGGAATFIVTSAGESVLIDSGNPGGRDAKRILAAAKALGLAAIDHHVITHWHGDHFGATEEIAKALPVGRFYDHGPSVEGTDFDKKFAWYLALSKDRRTILHPGDAIPLKPDPAGRPQRLLCVASHGGTLAGKAVNPTQCAAHPAKPDDRSDNACSVSLLLTVGDFRFLNCGDLTWNIEHKLVCPENVVGTVDVFQVNHHGLEVSNNPALINAVDPRVAVFNNGSRKGGGLNVNRTLKALTGLQAVFQVHRNVTLGDADQTTAARTANADAKCEGHGIRLELEPSGKAYTVTVEPAGKPERFEVRADHKPGAGKVAEPVK